MSIQKKELPEIIRETFNFDGSDLIFELNHYAFKADAALTVQKGETVVLATVTSGKMEITENFIPLSIEYLEKYYAGGLISSSRFIKREMRPSDSATLKARQVDHAIRSLFPKSWRKPVSVIITVLAYDGLNDPEQLSVIAASTALMLSSVPFAGPSASIKVGLDMDKKFIWSPTTTEEEASMMDIVVSVVGKRVLNIEGWADQVSEDVLSKLLAESVEKIQPVLEFQKILAGKYGREKQEYSEKPAPQELIDRTESEYGEKIMHALLSQDVKPGLMTEEMNLVKADIAEKLKTEAAEAGEEKPTFTTNDIEIAAEYIARKYMRKMVLSEKKRVSKRDLDMIRPLKIEVGVLPRVHGSAVFSRGILTQSLSVLTLGSARMAQTLESFEGEESKRFMHHYNSPNYSFGDAGRYSYYPGRREVGHGNIGENALRRVIPAEDSFPYTIRVSSEIMSSNGSTSMAATCAATLALLDGGVPLKAMVAGIALGLVTDDNDLTKFEILTDMEDVEDYYGDMDFKVCGTETGITAIQMDNKLQGVPVEILVAAFKRAKQAIVEVLGAMKEVIPAPRAELSVYAPKVEIIKIAIDKIGELIGPGGKNIKSILEKCENKVEIDIQDDGTVNILAVNEDMRKKAVELVNSFVGEAEIGKTYEGVVGKIAEYGMFVDVTPNISGLVHVSELSNTFVKDVNELFKLGDVVRVKVTGKDDKGRLKLSVKQADPA